MLYQDQKDETLVMLTLAGEPNAYETLVVRYQSTVISAAAVVTRNHFMAEDAAQDAFVTAWMKLNTLQDPSKFAPWVCRIAKNCALRTAMRFQSFLPLDNVENLALSDTEVATPSELYALSEEKDELHESIGRLPSRVRTIIQLHYFEGLSIAEIADRMCISEGTVKWQLHDGRKRIRKELCAMNEKWNDTLVRRVMKKVEELKLWQLNNSKNGFEAVYKDVLREVEELPESCDKYHALADVLMRGWWWLPGEKNDALFARVKDAAERGKNDEVMEFIVSREDSRIWGSAKIEFIRDKQIPRLEKAGFVRALAREWFWLGYWYYNEKQPEKGAEAYDKVRALLQPNDLYYALVPYAREMHGVLADALSQKDQERFLIGCTVEEYRRLDGKLRFWNRQNVGKGRLNSVDRDVIDVFRNSSRCDGFFFADGLSVGQTHVGSDGTTLTFAGENETVETPCGRFEGCQLWITAHTDETYGRSVVKSYYKDGVGIVRHERRQDGQNDVRLLKSYHIAGGGGLLPLSVGNTWEYAHEYSADVISARLKISVSYADGERILLASSVCMERLRYDETLWLDAIQEVRNEYCKDDGKGNYRIHDVFDAIKRAEKLAKTPIEKAHTAAACSVARRILETDQEFNPDYTAVGHWNFFSKNRVCQTEDGASLSYHFRWSFEWKNTDGSVEQYPILYNDVFGILQDATKCIWSEEWRAGTESTVEFMLWDTHAIRTKILCEACEPITTKAGTFEDCIKLSLDIGGLKDGLAYRGGKKEYYFAKGVGIVRTVNEFFDGARKAIYELTAFVGTGEGYMPIADGMMRRYDALDLTDGYVGAAVYTYVADEDGEIVIFADRTGIREIQSPITQYSYVQNEAIEEQLWESKKHKESRLRHDVNNLQLLLHFLGRPSRYWAEPEKAVAWNKYRMQIMEGLGENGEIPRAWWGVYASTCFRTACALFGCKRKDEGYAYLERSFELAPKWDGIPKGEELEVGDPLIFGDVRIPKGSKMIRLPNGEVEPNSYREFFNDKIANLIYYGLTAAHGWEWFNPVREEALFKEYVERAKKLKELYK